jgi:diguanylate cyclase (GGDEF)-like protein/PAS domain S-box-containing protein
MLKKNILDIISPRVVGIDPDASVREAARKMQDNRISCIVVLEGGRPVGIFTERALVALLADQGPGIRDLPMREVMSSPVKTVSADTFVYEAYGVFTTESVRHVVVVDEDGSAVGVVTQSDIISQIGTEYFQKVKSISQLMSTRIHTVAPDEPLSEALAAMARRNISCVIAAVDSRPVGLITERDILGLLSNDLDLDQTVVSRVMSAPVQTVPTQTPVFEAAWIMRREHIRRLVVVDEAGAIEGLATQTDIIKAMEGRFIEALKVIIREKDAALQDTMMDLYDKSVYLENILRSSIDMGIVATDPVFQIIYFNPAAEEILGRQANEVMGRDVREFHILEGLDMSRFNMAIERVRKGLHHEFTLTRNGKSGEDRIIQARAGGIWSPDNDLSGYVLMLRDVTDKKKAEETIRHLAYHDALTDLPNRFLFNERLSMEVARARRGGAKLALMLLDLDRFKEINDTYGHHGGDAVLKAVAERLSASLRASDMVARVGGDEFMLILPDIFGAKTAQDVGAKLISVVEQPLEYEGRTLDITTSLGVAIFPDHAETEDDLIKLADNAMYRAKEHGRDSGRSQMHMHTERKSG